MAPRTTLLAVSGTLQDGFELRGNMDHPSMRAVLIGDAVVCGVKAHLDIKDAGCREYDAQRARVNPANVVTGDEHDTNLYAVYLVHEEVVLKALLGEPRYLAIAPDAVRVRLNDERTSPAVRALLFAAARELAAESGCTAKPLPSEASILTVLSTYKAPSFVPLPARSTGSALTSFPEGLAQFAGVDVREVRTPGIAEAALRAAEKTLDGGALSQAHAVLGSGSLDPAKAPSGHWHPRLAALWDGARLARLAAAAGFAEGKFGAELAALAGTGQSHGCDGAGRGVMGLDANGEQCLLPGVSGPSLVPMAAAGVAQPVASEAAMAAAQALLASEAVAVANGRARELVAAVRPTLVRVCPAKEVLPAMSGGQKLILHAGPPLPGGFKSMCGPMRGAILGAILLEGWAADAAAAEALALSGTVCFAPCHEHAAVGPMAGIICPSMPLLVVVDAADAATAAAAAALPSEPAPTKRRKTTAPPACRAAYASLNEGLGKVLRFGAHSDAVLARLRWMVEVLGPTLDQAVTQGGSGGIELRPLLGASLAMGDDGHNRCKALTALFLQALTPALFALPDPAASQAVAKFICANAHFGLNVAMAASKLALDTITDVPSCTYVSALCRNGIQFGVRVSGTSSAWNVAESPMVPSAVWFPGYGPGDACRDLGDSAITETLGLGAPAMACSPALMAFVGGDAADAVRYTEEAKTIYAAPGLWKELQIPQLDFAGVPMLLDAAKVVATSTRPAINTGVAHKEPGVGQIGAGVSRAPLAAFEQAVLQLAAGLVPVSIATVPSALPFPFAWRRGKCALIMIDWQKDFLDVGGFGHTLGNDVSLLQAALKPAAAVLAAARAAKIPVVHTLEAHVPDLSDCPSAKIERCSAIGTTLDPTRGRVLIMGEPGNAIVDAVAPLPGELCIHKPGKGAFWSTPLLAELNKLRVTSLIVTGVTTEVCVQSTVREANDRGFDCLVVSDATESYFPKFKASTLEMIVAQNGIVGWTAESSAVVEALKT